MKRPVDPVFVAARAYRRHRLADAARLLPMIGILLFLLPMLWDSAGGLKSSTAGVYIFGVWFVLILSAARISRALTRSSGDDPPGDAGDPEETQD